MSNYLRESSLCYKCRLLLAYLHGAFHCGQIVALVDCVFSFAESRLRLWLYCGFQWLCWRGGPEIKSHNGLWLYSADVGGCCQVPMRMQLGAGQRRRTDITTNCML